MFELRTLNWPTDRADLLALDTSYVVNRQLRLDLMARSASLIEEALPAPIRRAYDLGEIIDALPGYAWVHVASVETAIAGFGALGFEQWNRRARLEHLYVSTAARGRGIGRAIVEAALGAAGALGARGIWVETQSTNSGAVRFYERTGFSWCGFDRTLYDQQLVDDAEVGLFFWQSVDQHKRAK